MGTAITFKSEASWIKWHPTVVAAPGIGGRRKRRRRRIGRDRVREAALTRIRRHFAEVDSDPGHWLHQLPDGPTLGPIEVEPYVGARVLSLANSVRAEAVEHTLAAHAGGPWWTLGNGRTIDLLERLRRGTMRVVPTT